MNLMHQHPNFLFRLHLVAGFKFWHEWSSQLAHDWLLLTQDLRMEFDGDALTLARVISQPDGRLCDVVRVDFSEIAISLGYLVIRA